MRKKASCRRLFISSIPSKCLLTAKALNITINRMPSISSMISTEITPEAKRFPLKPMSSKALYMMVVELMLSIPPRKILSIMFQPKSDATIPPMPIMQHITIIAVRMGCIPMRTIFLKENSKPNVNMRNMTPKSLHSSMPPMLLTEGV